MTTYNAQIMDRLWKRLDQAMQLECSDYGCEGLGATGSTCQGKCAIDRRCDLLRARIAEALEHPLSPASGEPI